MIIGVMTVEFELSQVSSLKGKRAILNRLKSRTRNQFNVSIAEVEANDVWNVACIGFATVANNRTYANQVMDKVLDFLETIRDCTIVDHDMDFMHYD